MIRHLQRLYMGDDKEAVRSDTLYCMSLMQHQGAPTRLMDWMYSPLVAAYFALEYALDNCNPKEHQYPKCAVWLLNQEWCKAKAEDAVGDWKSLLRRRSIDDSTRDDSTFVQLYASDNPRTFVFQENPLLLHRRLHLQQGVFLCPGDVTKDFVDNLRALAGWHLRENMMRFVSAIPDESQLLDALDMLNCMNINRETLFPGLDGFAKSMAYRQSLYLGLAKARGTTG